MSDDFGALSALAVDLRSTSRMPIILPGDVDPLTDNTGGADEKGNLLPGKEAYIEFLPWDSEENRALDRKKHVEGVRKGFRQRSAADLRKEAEDEDPVEEQVERLVTLATGWHLVGPDRAVINVPFTKENARKLFSDAGFGWLRRRAYSYVVNERNFMPASPKS
jgi:hypothetical protein